LRSIFLALGRLRVNSFPTEWPDPNLNKVYNYLAVHAILLVLQANRVCQGWKRLWTWTRWYQLATLVPSQLLTKDPAENQALTTSKTRTKSKTLRSTSIKSVLLTHRRSFQKWRMMLWRLCGRKWVSTASWIAANSLVIKCWTI
jgi:hypothetical protein